MIHDSIRWIKLVVSVFFVGVLVFVFSGAFEDSDAVCFSGSCVSVEVARTPDEHAFGLMNRTYLCPDCGMIFVYPYENSHYFWMKNTLIPLDMIWMDGNGTVVYIERGAESCISEPCTIYGPDFGSVYVLEVNGGYADEHGISVGDMAEIRLL